jgi:hypothetical protein
MTKQLHTVEEVISVLGGTKAVAELTNKTANPSTVPMWKSRGKFPATTYAKIQSALDERGLSAPMELWGMQ